MGAEYYKNIKATEEMYRGDWCSVGDMAVQDEEGFYYIVDRKKDMIVSGGVNIYPSEIEDIIRFHPGVVDVAVIGVPDAKWGEEVKAIIVARKGYQISEEEIMGLCKDNLASYKKPKSIDFVDEIPKTGANKTSKKALRDKYWKDEKIKVG